MTDDVKIVYHIDEEPTPYVIKVSPSDRSGKVLLGDFRAALNAKGHSYKYFFKAVDDDFGEVKEELINDSSILPCANGRIVAWLVTADGAQQGGAQTAGGAQYSRVADSGPMQRMVGLGVHGGAQSQEGFDDEVDTLDEDDLDGDGAERQSIRDELAPLDAFDAYRARFGVAAAQSAMASRGYIQSHQHAAAYYQQAFPIGVPVGVPPNMLMPRGGQLDASSSLASSDVDETVSFLESEAESSRLSTATGTTTTMSWIAARGTRKQLRRRRKAAPISRASSFSSMTDSTMSLNIITVTLNVDTCNFLGISIVGQSSRAGGDGGIYVGSIMKGGAVAQDGRIEPGDMLLEVNGVSFENMSNDEAVRALREAVSKPGPITLVVAKCWDAHPTPKGHFTIPKQEPVRPIDPRAWIAHTQAAQQCAVPPGTSNSTDRDSLPPANSTDPFSSVQLGGSLHSSAVAPNGPAQNQMMHAAPSTIIDSVSTAMEYRGLPPRMPAPPMSNAQPPSALMRSAQPFGSLQAQQMQLGMFVADGPVSGPSTDPEPGPRSAADGESEGDGEMLRLNTQTDLVTIVQALAQSDSGLEIRDRIWLKITIPNAFIGSDLVDWLYTHVDGLPDRREAKKLATELVRAGLIRHTVNKSSFSEKCYYVLSDTALRYTTPAPLAAPAPMGPMPTPASASALYAHTIPYGISQVPVAPTPGSYNHNVAINDPTLDEIDSVSDIAQHTNDALRWTTHLQRQREAAAAAAAAASAGATPQSAAQALQQAYANAPVQPGAAKPNPYARYVSNPLFTAQTQQYATPCQPGTSLQSGPPPSYLEAQFASLSANAPAGVQFSNDSASYRDRTKTPAALSLTPSVRSGAADNCVCLKPLKSLLATKENEPSAPAGSNFDPRARDAAVKQRPPVPIRSSMPTAPMRTGLVPDAAPHGDSASATSSSSAATANSGEHAAARRAAEQSQAVAMMSHFAGAGAVTSVAPHDALDRLPLANANSSGGGGSGSGQQSALYTPSALTQIATA